MFAEVSEDDITDLLELKDSKSTKRCITHSLKSFRGFLGEDNEFETFDKPKLNEKLRLFFASLRKTDGNHLKKSTLTNYRYGLTKYLKEHCSIDITKDAQFAGSKDVFKAVVVNLKKKGYASTEHKPPISKEDLQKLYNTNSIAINTTTPYGLQKKVWFDIMFYLCRRGQENLRSMTKNTFAIKTDSSGREYVHQQIDEYDKNHRDEASPDDTVGEARMYAREGDPLCPVLSFKLYLEKLHPALNDFWQRTKDSFDITDTTWYCKAPMGKNSFISNDARNF
ncbi:Hypothetical predicted protein [Mytilus galloprovincialis]|uniref:Uncharacterized protein n=1 Tax=Mytilus galloprovincialis TaxID=29158 RepID=A0A8B6FKA9_MYTGA|nr:Hypothetical predicted protein [Mytilus galloprovincialis]